LCTVFVAAVKSGIFTISYRVIEGRFAAMSLKFKNGELLHLSTVFIAAIALTMFSISFSLIDRIYDFFAMFSALPIAEFLINVGFLTLMGLLWLTYRHWREAAKRRAELANIIDSISPDVLIVVDPYRNIVMCNSSVKRMFGYSQDEVISQKTEVLYSDRRSDPGKGCEIFEALKRDGFHIGLATGKKKNGTTVSVEVITGRLREGDGAVLLLRDITERKGAEDALRESERLIRATLNSTGDGILVVNERGQVTHANARLTQMWRIPPDPIKTKDEKKLLDSLIEQLEEPGPFFSKFQVPYRTSQEDHDTVVLKDGRTFEWYSCPLVRNAKVTGRVWSFRDVSDRKRAEQERMERERLEGIVEKGGTISHELNQPLQSVSGFSDLLMMETKEGDSVHGYAKAIQDQVHRMGELTKKILEIKDRN
jgi:PAS domain S-box-containing protein